MNEKLQVEPERLEDPLWLEIDGHFQGRGWRRDACEHCGRQFYTKRGASLCGEFECVSRYAFTEFSKRRKPLSIEDLESITDKFFLERNFRKAEPRSLVNKISDTFFVCAGIQILDEKIFNEKEPEEPGPVFVLQPVVRAQFINQVGKIEGVSTSFVNCCTEALNPTLAEHLSYFENWLDYLSILGFFVNDMSFSLEENTTDWGRGEFKRLVINCNYGGLHLGDAGYFYDIPQRTRNSLTVSDIGFGLERIVWALNKSESYFDALGPLPYVFQKKLGVIDAVRTSVLIAASGVRPDARGIGQKLRMFSKKSVDFGVGSNIKQLIAWYYKYWERFTELKEPLGRVQDVLQEERNRNMNRILGQKLGLKKIDSGDSLDVFIMQLVSSGISINRVKAAFFELL